MWSYNPEALFASKHKTRPKRRKVMVNADKAVQVMSLAAAMGVDLNAMAEEALRTGQTVSSDSIPTDANLERKMKAIDEARAKAEAKREKKRQRNLAFVNGSKA